MPQTSSKNPILAPIWAVRGLPMAATLLVAGAFFATRHPVFQSMCIGAALGLLITFCVYSYQIKSVILKDTPQPSDATPYSIT